MNNAVNYSTLNNDPCCTESIHCSLMNESLSAWCDASLLLLSPQGGEWSCTNGKCTLPFNASPVLYGSYIPAHNDWALVRCISKIIPTVITIPLHAIKGTIHGQKWEISSFMELNLLCIYMNIVYFVVVSGWRMWPFAAIVE